MQPRRMARQTCAGVINLCSGTSTGEGASASASAGASSRGARRASSSTAGDGRGCRTVPVALTTSAGPYCLAVPPLYRCDAVGPRVAASKVRHRWSLLLRCDETSRKGERPSGQDNIAFALRLDLLHSRVSGVKRVYVDGQQVYKTRRKNLAWSYVHEPTATLLSLTSESDGFRLNCGRCETAPLCQDQVSLTTSPSPSPRQLPDFELSWQPGKSEDTMTLGVSHQVTSACRNSFKAAASCPEATHYAAPWLPPGEAEVGTLEENSLNHDDLDVTRPRSRSCAAEIRTKRRTSPRPRRRFLDAALPVHNTELAAKALVQSQERSHRHRSCSPTFDKRAVASTHPAPPADELGATVPVSMYAPEGLLENDSSLDVTTLVKPSNLGACNREVNLGSACLPTNTLVETVPVVPADALLATVPVVVDAPDGLLEEESTLDVTMQLKRSSVPVVSTDDDSIVARSDFSCSARRQETSKAAGLPRSYLNASTTASNRCGLLRPVMPLLRMPGQKNAQKVKAAACIEANFAPVVAMQNVGNGEQASADSKRGVVCPVPRLNSHGSDIVDTLDTRSTAASTPRPLMQSRDVTPRLRPVRVDVEVMKSGAGSEQTSWTSMPLSARATPVVRMVSAGPSVCQPLSARGGGCAVRSVSNGRAGPCIGAFDRVSRWPTPSPSLQPVGAPAAASGLRARSRGTSLPAAAAAAKEPQSFLLAPATPRGFYGGSSVSGSRTPCAPCAPVAVAFAPPPPVVSRHPASHCRSLPLQQQCYMR
eukprot:TRINITY_DN5081_c0_g1_i1.p1 TRINITY_DN5081_c0_g1~~TRINITY_DN5081_c0_g1_i1.p1  ORF type:complete len:843 (+),score=98.96 TRINITY_DN5081_c0_g1_i1:237-2531(+)